MTALREAIDIAGGTNALARKLEVGPNVISNWLARGGVVPAPYCPKIERETGVRCERLNGSIDWTFLRATAAAA
jgi:DNA-binding transcriptional regulator YdaS (Cro superfamily)